MIPIFTKKFKPPKYYPIPFLYFLVLFLPTLSIIGQRWEIWWVCGRSGWHGPAAGLFCWCPWLCQKLHWVAQVEVHSASISLGAPSLGQTIWQQFWQLRLGPSKIPLPHCPPHKGHFQLPKGKIGRTIIEVATILGTCLLYYTVYLCTSWIDGNLDNFSYFSIAFFGLYCAPRTTFSQ